MPPARVEGACAFVSIMEGCSKYCSYCVVPYTRGEEVSRPFDDVLGPVWTLLKTGLVAVVVIWVRVSWPRLREDQLQRFAWLVLVPVALVQLALTAVVVVAR